VGKGYVLTYMKGPVPESQEEGDPFVPIIEGVEE
jgi:hypothetical protein